MRDRGAACPARAGAAPARRALDPNEERLCSCSMFDFSACKFESIDLAAGASKTTLKDFESLCESLSIEFIRSEHDSAPDKKRL
jgi:hypothetical protein